MLFQVINWLKAGYKRLQAMLPYIYADPTFWGYLSEYRVLWAAGGKGSGKTAFTVALAAELLRRNRVQRIVANIATCFVRVVPPEDIEDHPLPLEAAFILDEAGVHFEKSREVVPFMAYSRHDALYLLIASTIDPPYKARALRVLRAATLVGGVRLYRWQWWGPDHADARKPIQSGLLLAFTGRIYEKYQSGIAAHPKPWLDAFKARYKRLEAIQARL